MSNVVGSRRPRVLFALGLASVAAYFVYFTWPALRSGFTQDDLMNLYRSWHPDMRVGWRDVVFFFRFTASYRPVGNLFYRAIFELSGLNPLPFRVAVYLLLALNLWLSYCVVRRVSGSRTVAGLAALLLAYHREFWGFYINTGMCYDLLCFALLAGAFLYYIRNRPLGWLKTAVWAVLYLLCLNAKEVAVALPVLIAVYELVYSGWSRAQWRVVITGGVMAALFAFGRVLNPQGIVAGAAYKVDFGFGPYLSHAHYFLRAALYNWPTPAISILIGILMIAGAMFSGNLRFALAWMLVAILPIAFIAQRELDAACVATLGLAFYIATLLAGLGRLVKLRPAIVFALVLLGLGAVHRRYGPINFYEANGEARHIAEVQRQLKALQPSFPKSSRVLFVRDPFPEFEFATRIMLQLMTRDPGMVVERADHGGAKKGPFDFVFSYEDGRLIAQASPIAAQAVAAEEIH